MREDELVDVLRPEEVEVFEMWYFSCDGVFGEFFEHDFDIYEAVAAAVDEDDRRFDVAGRKLGDLVVAIGCCDGKWGLHIIIVHLKALVADDLKPVNHAFGAGEGVKVRVRSELLMGADVAAGPVEEEGEGNVDYADEDGRVEDRLPHCGGGEDAAAAESKEEDVGGGFDEGVDDAVMEACWGHGGCEADEDVEFVVQIWVDGEGGEGLGSALGEADVGKRGLCGGFEDIIYAVGDVMEGELVHGEVPELDGGRREMRGLFGVFVSAVITKPDIVALLHELEWQASLFLGHAYPDLTVHEQAVMEIHHSLFHAAFSSIDSGAFLTLPPSQPV